MAVFSVLDSIDGTHEGALDNFLDLWSYFLYKLNNLPLRTRRNLKVT